MDTYFYDVEIETRESPLLPVVRWGVKALGKECFQMTDQHVEQFIAQPNEL